jgi:hypothetical protein
MKKEYVIGGLALLGAIGVVAYLLKPKAPRKNSDGFFGADGGIKYVNSGSDDGRTAPPKTMGGRG